MGLEYKRIQRKKHINKKIKKFKNWYNCNDFEKWFNNDEFKGKLHKGKIHCGCPLCKPWKYPPYEKKAKEKNFIKETNKEIKEFL